MSDKYYSLTNDCGTYLIKNPEFKKDYISAKYKYPQYDNQQYGPGAFGIQNIRTLILITKDEWKNPSLLPDFNQNSNQNSDPNFEQKNKSDSEEVLPYEEFITTIKSTRKVINITPDETTRDDILDSLQNIYTNIVVKDAYEWENSDYSYITIVFEEEEPVDETKK